MCTWTEAKILGYIHENGNPIAALERRQREIASQAPEFLAAHTETKGKIQ